MEFADLLLLWSFSRRYIAFKYSSLLIQLAYTFPCLVVIWLGFPARTEHKIPMRSNSDQFDLIRRPKKWSHSQLSLSNSWQSDRYEGIVFDALVINLLI